VAQPLELARCVLSGSTAALLTVAKPNKINPVLFISPSKTSDDHFKAHGHHGLWQAMGVYIDHTIITKNVISILDKMTVTKMGFPFVDTDLNAGLAHLVDKTQQNWEPTVISGGMDSSNDDTTPVLALVPVMCPIGYRRPAPMGNIDDLDTKALLQNCHDINLAWSNVIGYLIHNTAGKSINMINPVPTTFCDNYIPAPQKPYWKAYLADKVWTPTEAMTSQQEDFTIVKN
jgi:hypothetical protein